MRSTAILLFLCVVCPPASAAEREAALTPFQDGPQFGYIDPRGREVISPRFSQAGRFTQDGLATVQLNGKFGYVRPDGSFAIEPLFDYADAFSEGKAIVVRDGVLQAIDASGHVLFQIEQTVVAPFRDGRLLIVKGDSFGFLDGAGRVVVKPQFKEGAHSYSEGLAAMRREIRRDSVAEIYWLYIDRDGNEAMGRRFALAQPFAEGLAPVVALEPRPDGKRLWEYVDRTGKTVIEPRFAAAFPFSEGLGRVAIVDEAGFTRYGFVDRSGRLAISCRFDYASDFHDGLAAVQVRGKWGFVDVRGRRVIPARFESASDFHNGLATVTAVRDGASIETLIDTRGNRLREWSLR